MQRRGWRAGSRGVRKAADDAVCAVKLDREIGDDHNAIGVAWFTPETWRELRAHPEAKIEDTYSEYVRRYERALAAFTAQGFRVVKVPIDISLMIEWCHAHGYEIDSGGRAVFATVLLANDAGEDVMSIEFRDDARTVQ